jgi:hypothetical protein
METFHTLKSYNDINLNSSFVYMETIMTSRNYLYVIQNRDVRG